MADVGCAGVLVSDIFCGPMDDLPREGQLLAIDAIELGAGGCAANVAIGLAKQGITVELAGCVGTDSSATSLLNSLEDDSVGCSHVTATAEYPTSKTVILVVAAQDRRYIHTFGANKAFAIEHIDRNWIQDLKVFYLGGLLILPAIDLEELGALLRYCRQNDVVTVVDVVVPQDSAGADDVKSILPEIDYFLPNYDEAAVITGETDPLDQLQAFSQYGANTVVVTLGENGSVATRDGRFWRAPAFSVDLVDPSGSGDAFTAGFIAGIVNGSDMADVLRRANAYGASAARALGTTGSLFTVDEVCTFLADNPKEVEEWT